ncbi:DAK2 domain-containing protein [Nocardioides aurantiacus]|uniref:DAK2 domain-containing protein n=1 Tax=Nocardioides aurantiacus TaxID=86796 RepID=UPI00403F99C8
MAAAEHGDEQGRVATFDLVVVRRFADLAVEALAAAREEVDALNVYPVPDGDTGTNMFLTVEAAREALLARLEEEPDDLRGAMRAYAHGALLGARGNSGVILSQLVGALVRRIGRAGPEDRSSTVFADGMRRAVDAAYDAVGTPVEGTILSVARAAAEAADAAAAAPGSRLGAVVHAAVRASREALGRTPEQLPVLARAGVVDAGGRGLCVVLAAMESAITGEHTVAPLHVLGSPLLPVAALPTGDLTADGPAYEVMYLLAADDDAVPALRAELAPLGDSLVVVGGDGLWNVHVHVDDVGAAIEAGIRAGTPRRVEVVHFAEQVERAQAGRGSRPAAAEGGLRGRTVLALALGPGLAALFREAGAEVLEVTTTRRPSSADLLRALLACPGEEVVVLPNHAGTIAAAEAAAHEAAQRGRRVVVVPTRAQVQGIAALAVHEPGRALDNDVVHMTDAARGARHGALTVATEPAMTSAGPCSPGDVLGAVQGDFVIVGDDLFEVATGVLERLLGTGGELVTLVAGAEAGDLAQACEHWVDHTHPGTDVVVLVGGQEHYPLLVSVE